ncbi:hypothetical protein EKD04_000140 [Chloroflexales bacterium ZM16-3]|nr:hypothetical protein [Chloroflexales bacterium ZM16-3]
MGRLTLMAAHSPNPPLLVAYDRARACDLLRSSTAHGLRDALRGGRFGDALSPADRAELDELLTAWVQRALGSVFLRDALLVDGQRGPRAFGLICACMTRAYAPLPTNLADTLRTCGSADLSLGDLSGMALRDPALARLADLAGREGLSVALLDQPVGYPPPADLDSLLPAPLARQTFPADAFEPPVGVRRSLAVALVVAGMTLLIVPMLGGSIPEHPAGLPLALITLALMVGIRARWLGFVGALCMWLVPNLPGFRHSSGLIELLPSLPLLIVGMALLILDRRVRALWVWVRQQVGR